MFRQQEVLLNVIPGNKIHKHYFHLDKFLKYLKIKYSYGVLKFHVYNLILLILVTRSYPTYFRIFKLKYGAMYPYLYLIRMNPYCLGSTNYIETTTPYTSV